MSKAFTRFILGTVGFYILWFGLYEFWIKPIGKIDHFITENITIVVCYLLNLSGYESHYTIGKKLGETYVFLKDDILPTVRIGAACNGLEMLMIYAIFIIWYPGNKYLKGIYIVLGMFFIHLLNILRNYILTLLAIERSNYFELFHRYIFIFLIYGVIFILWMWWANKISKLHINRG